MARGIVAQLSIRLLTGKKRNSFLSFISGVSLFGVCLGVAALTVVMGVMEGFETELRSIITGTHSHIVLYSGRHLITNYQELVERVQKIGGEEIEAISPYLFSEVMLAKGSRVQGSMLEGIEEETTKQTTQITRHLVKGTMPENSAVPTIILGSVVAENLNAKEGDEISVISPFYEKDNLQPKSKRFRVSGIISTGMYDYDSKYSMIQVDAAREFFKIAPGVVSALKIKTKNPTKSYLLSDRIERELSSPYHSRDWTELNRNLLYAIRLQKSVIFVILTAIIVVAAFNIMSTLMMMMSEKKKEMSILKAMGLGPRKSAGVFIFVGSVIGISGAAAGVALGLLLCQILVHTKLIQLPPDIYFISYLPVDIRMGTLTLIASCATAVAVLATLYPGYKVAMESPVEGLRYE